MEPKEEKAQENRSKKMDRQASRTNYDRDDRSRGSRSEKGEKSEVDKLLEEIAAKVRKYNFDTQKFYKMSATREKGTLDERDFEAIIKKDIKFNIKSDEMDMLLKHYAIRSKKGFIDYQKFDDDIYAINKKEKQRSNARKDSKKPEEEVKKVTELPLSVRPPTNIPTENRYSMRNTVSGQYPDSRKQKLRKVRIGESILQDIIKATYLRDVLIQDAFAEYGKGRSRVINQDSLKEAFDAYGIKCDSKTLKDTYTRLLDTDRELTDEMIDLAVEDSARKGIEEIQKSILDIVNRGIKKQPENHPKD